jgi:PEGA domain
VNIYLRTSGALLCFAALSACATITRGTRQAYVIETDPPGAQIALSTGLTCVSPCRLQLKRNREFSVTATMEGYQPAEARVDSVVRAGGAAGMAGNLLVGGIIGGVVDATNGSMHDLRPNPLRIAMTPVGGPGSTVVASDALAPAEGETPPADPPAEPEIAVAEPQD